MTQKAVSQVSVRETYPPVVFSYAPAESDYRIVFNDIVDLLHDYLEPEWTTALDIDITYEDGTKESTLINIAYVETKKVEVISQLDINGTSHVTSTYM